jgi:hypothetical protein
VSRRSLAALARATDANELEGHDYPPLGPPAIPNLGGGHAAEALFSL